MEQVSLNEISNVKALKKIEETFDQLIIDKQRIENYKDLIEKNIADTNFEISKTDNQIHDKREEQIELVIEMDKVNYDIECKLKEI